MTEPLGWRHIPGWTCKQLENWYEELAYTLHEGTTHVEIGVAYGRSLACFAENAPHRSIRIIGVDIWQEHQGKDQLDPETWARVTGHGTPLQACVAELRRCSPNTWATVTLRQGTGAEAAADHADGTVDSVFIDEHHTFESVGDAIKAWLPKLSDNGVMSGHDCNDHYPGVLQAVREYLPQTDLEIRSPHPDDNGWGGVFIWRKR